jgi:hypothetical protein
LEEASENTAEISNLCQGKESSCDTKDFIWSDDHLATHYSFQPITAILAVRNTQNEDVDDEGENEEEEEEAVGEQDILTKIQTLQAFLNYCIQLRTAF